MYFVCRQNYYYSHLLCVEVSEGGLDYAGADMLCHKYPGEAQEYADPLEAVQVAKAIRDAWKKDEPGKKIVIVCGCTGGMGLELEPVSNKALDAWAKKASESLPRCGHCGDILNLKSRDVCWNPDFGDDEKFCDSNCYEKAMGDYQQDMEEGMEEEPLEVLDNNP